MSRFLSLAQVADELELDRATVWRMAKRREFPVHRFGRALRVARADLEAYIRTHREPSRQEQVYLQRAKLTVLPCQDTSPRVDFDELARRLGV